MSNPYPPDPSGQPRPPGSYDPYQQPSTYPQYDQQPVPGTSGNYPYQQPQQSYQQYSQPQPGAYGAQPSQSQPNIIVNVQQGLHQQYSQPQFLVAVAPPVNGKATAAMILGFCSFIFWFFTGIPAVILGHMALNEINQSRGTQGGKGQALTGLILGYLAVGGLALCVVCYFAGALATFGASPH